MSPAPTARVLVVDDDIETRESISETLEDAGFETIEAKNGRDALEKLEQAPKLPTLILLDLMMPVMDGIEFRTEIARNPAFAGIPIVVMTAYSDGQQKAEDLTAAGFLKKPVTLKSLLEICQRYAPPA